MSDIKIYDTIIIGGGPAGYTAALFAVRAGLKTLVLEKFSAGGQMAQTNQIDNYPGFENGIEGFSLGHKMKQGAQRFGVKSLQKTVFSVDFEPKIKKITTDSGDFYAKTVIIATGAKHKHLGLENEENLIGKGLGYCAACDGMFFKGKNVAVIGGGNSAAADSLLLSKICKKVYLIHRRDTLRATKIYHEPILNSENIEIKWNSKAIRFIFDDTVKGIEIKNIKTNSLETIAVDGIFISIGRTPETEIFKDILELDNNGYIIADETTKTNIDGVFAAGDVRTKIVRQIVTAVSDGAVAAHFAEEYLSAK